MPLIMISGLPTSGKTTRARQLYDYLSERTSSLGSNSAPAPSSPTPADNPATVPPTPPSRSQPRYRLHLISDDALSLSRSAYDLSPEQLPAHTRSANASEKDARAAVYGAVKRVLSDRDIVILDGLNYIKGWRYQLFCEAKAARTPSVVLRIGCAVEKAREVNERRLAKRDAARRPVDDNDGGGGGDGAADTRDAAAVAKGAGVDGDEPYEPGNWENLVFRYEEPNQMTRWDSPLFALIWDDDEARTREVFSRLWEAIAGEGRPVVKPNSVTVQRTRDVGGDYLYVLERETQDVVRRVLDAVRQDGGSGAGEVPVPRGGGDGAGSGLVVVEVPPGRSVGPAQLQRLRRAYVGLNRGGIGLERMGNPGVDRIRESFVAYLNDHLERED